MFDGLKARLDRLFRERGPAAREYAAGLREALLEARVGITAMRDALARTERELVATGRRYDLNQFHSPKQFTGPVRCDLHPRWNRDGTRVCIDGCHDPQRQVYVLDVGEVVKS